MQKIFFEKWIDLNNELKELTSLSVDESINYKIESTGVKAIGSLLVKGEYNGDLKFDDSIDLDILATFDKIVDQRDFNIKVEDFDYTIKNGNIKVMIEVGIHGVIDGDDRYVKDENNEEIDTLQEIETLIREEVVDDNDNSLKLDVVEDFPLVNEENKINTEEKEVSEKLQEKVYLTKTRPIFQDDEDSVGTYYLYIVKETDSYSDVANRYGIDEQIIRDYNQNKELETGHVLIIPYVS